MLIAHSRDTNIRSPIYPILPMIVAILPFVHEGTVFAESRLTENEFDPKEHRLIQSDRPDGRYLSSRGFVQHLMREVQPKLAFDPNFSQDEFEDWQSRVRLKVRELMRFPNVPPQPLPRFLDSVQREGYRVERWEIYPQPGSVVPVLMLIPDGVSAENPVPAVLCFPGSTRTKESLAGEEELYAIYEIERFRDENRMAMFYARAGIVAIAVDNPGIGETSDLERHSGRRIYDRTTLSRYLIDMDWHLMGLTTFQGERILQWMRTLNFIDPSRIALSGHSLGTIPVMYLAVLNPDIRAIVHNESLKSVIKSATVRTKPDSKGERPKAYWLGHCVPGLWEWFDYFDLLASLAPLEALYTEGGAQAHIAPVQRAYQIMGAEANLTVSHFPRYRDPANRRDHALIPEGLTREEYLRFVNLDVENHRFQYEVAVPWLKRVLK